jgi:hypothetical protein
MAARRAAAAAAPAPKDAVTVPVRLYIAQHNFVDDEPSAINPSIEPPDPAARLPLLPGQAMILPDSPAVPNPTASPSFIDLSIPTVTVNDAGKPATFLTVLLAAANVQFITNLQYSEDPVHGAGFLISFEFNGVKYTDVTTGEYELVPLDSPTDTPVPTNMWTGWDITYFAGIHRPHRFEEYPALAVNEYPIYPVYDSNGNLVRLDFVLDFTKTENVFNIPEPETDPEPKPEPGK